MFTSDIVSGLAFSDCIVMSCLPQTIIKVDFKQQAVQSLKQRNFISVFIWGYDQGFETLYGKYLLKESGS